jgi:transposase
VGGAAVFVALKHFERHIPGPLLVVWDHSKPHLAKIVREYLAAHPEIHVEWFPPHAPELNPEEFCHGNVK